MVDKAYAPRSDTRTDIPCAFTIEADFEDQKRGQEPIVRWPEGYCARLVPDPFSELPRAENSIGQHPTGRGCDGNSPLLVLKCWF
jgi:hypothetical protein